MNEVQASHTSARQPSHFEEVTGEQPQGSASHVLPAALIWVAFAYISFLPFLRGVGPIGLAFCVSCFAAVSITYGRHYFSWWLFLLALVGSAYAAASGMDLISRESTFLFRKSAILQQATYTLVLVVCVPALAYYHQQVERGDRTFLRLELALFIVAAIAKIALVTSISVEDESSIDSYRYGISQLLNVDILLVFIVARRWVFQPNRPKPLQLLLIVLLLATGSSAQAILVLLLMAAFAIFPGQSRWIAIALILAACILPFAAQPFAREIWAYDPNVGIRLFIWEDSFDRILANSGLGVGFGTETVREFYDVGNRTVSFSNGRIDQFIHIGAHNIFVDATYRMGIFGLFTLLGYLYSIIGKFFSRKYEMGSPLVYWAIATLVVSFTVNVALAGMLFLFGSIFLFGYLQAKQPNLAKIDIGSSTNETVSPTERRKMIAQSSDAATKSVA